MLSAEEKAVLTLLEELSASSLPLNEQSTLVTKINELLQNLQEENEAALLLAKPPVSSATFVKLCGRRLVAAQSQSLENYNSFRASKTKRLAAVRHESNAPEPSNENTVDPISDDKLTQSIYETKSESITRTLQRMRDIAHAEVLRGELNITELDMSSRTLRELQEKYSAVDILLNGSRRLVKLLDEAEKWDRWCMLASLGFLAFVMLYIIYRRILSGPIKILLWSLFQLIGIAKKVPSPQRLAAPHAVSQESSVLSSAVASVTANAAQTSELSSARIASDNTQSETNWDHNLTATTTAAIYTKSGRPHEEL